MTGECFSVSAQLDKCQTSLAVKAQPHEWHGLQVVLRLLQTNHCPLRRWTVHLKLDTVQFSAYLITQCSNVQVIWWHTPVIAYVSAVVLWHNLQQESGKHHWVSLHLVLLSAQKDKPVFSFSFHFACLFVFHEEAQQLFLHCTEQKCLDLCLWQQWERALCNGATDPGTMLLASTWKSRGQAQKLQNSVHRPEPSCHWLFWKPRLCFCGATRNRKATNERQQQTGNLCVWAESCRDTHSRNSYLFYGVIYTS